MQTRIIIEHDTVEALKSSPIWEQIMALMLIDESVSVIEVEALDDERKE